MVDGTQCDAIFIDFAQEMGVASSGKPENCIVLVSNYEILKMNLETFQ